MACFTGVWRDYLDGWLASGRKRKDQDGRGSSIVQSTRVVIYLLQNELLISPLYILTAVPASARCVWPKPALPAWTNLHRLPRWVSTTWGGSDTFRVEACWIRSFHWVSSSSQHHPNSPSPSSCSILVAPHCRSRYYRHELGVEEVTFAPSPLSFPPRPSSPSSRGKLRGSSHLLPTPV